MSADGKALRDAAVALLKEHRASVIRAIQIAALNTGLSKSEVSTDDIHKTVSIPPGIDRRVVGAAFLELINKKILVSSGRQKGTARAVAHARPVPIWRIADRHGARCWLIENPPIPFPDEPVPDIPKEVGILIRIVAGEVVVVRSNYPYVAVQVTDGPGNQSHYPYESYIGES